MKIGLIDCYDKLWAAGGECTKAQLRCLLASSGGQLDKVVVATKRPEAFSLRADERVSYAVPFSCPARWLRSHEAVLLRTFGRIGLYRDPRMREWDNWADSLGVDVLIPFSPESWWQPGPIPTCGMIYDFQHIMFPQYFSDMDICERNLCFNRIVERTDLVVVHSQSTRQDLIQFAPLCRDKIRIFHFPSLFAFDPLPEIKAQELQVLAKYGVEPEFMLVMNQFWIHKNHLQVIEALGLLQKSGQCPQVVMIGQPFDHRDPSGSGFSRILCRIAELQLENKAKILGFVPSQLRDVLIRSCKVLIQPSRCEGWNTAIEDAKAVGRPVIASDIPVHREQVPGAFSFVPPEDVEGMASAIRKADAELSPGSDYEKESIGLEDARIRLQESGRDLLNICSDAIAARNRRTGRQWNPGR